jgi:DNA-binding NarL/FixJ family response regulator
VQRVSSSSTRPSRAGKQGKGFAPGANGGVRISSWRIGGQELRILSYPLRSSIDIEALTVSELQVLDLLLVGESNAGIARRRHRSKNTVAKQVAAILRKLGASSRSEVVSKCARLAEARRRDVHSG